jgi:hypothetical protein
VVLVRGAKWLFKRKMLLIKKINLFFYLLRQYFHCRSRSKLLVNEHQLSLKVSLIHFSYHWPRYRNGKTQSVETTNRNHNQNKYCKK